MTKTKIFLQSEGFYRTLGVKSYQKNFKTIIFHHDKLHDFGRSLQVILSGRIKWFIWLENLIFFVWILLCYAIVMAHKTWKIKLYSILVVTHPVKWIYTQKNQIIRPDKIILPTR